MAYASIPHVEAKNTARGTFTSNTKPNASQVAQFIDQAAAMMEGAFAQGGYVVPFDVSSCPSYVQTELQNINAYGAAYYVECAAQTSQRREEFEEIWRNALKMMKAGEFVGLDKDTSESVPRSAGTATPIFAMDMIL